MSARVEVITIDREKDDPITVFLQDIAPKAGRVTIECYGRAWSAYWGAMPDGATVATFVARADAGYVLDNLARFGQVPMSRRSYLMKIVKDVQIALRHRGYHVAVAAYIDKGRPLTAVQCDEFRRLPMSFDDMVCAIYGAGARAGIASLMPELRGIEESRDICRAQLDRIHEYAHDKSAGPAVPDGYWEIKEMAANG